MIGLFSGETSKLTANDIERRFGISNILRFETAPGGLIRAVVSGPQADATIYTHGAHVTDWTPRGERPVLFTSSKSHFEAGMAIRGGVPVIFPWFGARADGHAGPMHGFARIVEWSMENARLRGDGAVELSLTSAPDKVSRELGYEAFDLRFRVAFGTALEMEMEVRNPSNAPFRFEEALHTYFAVGDIRKVSITGLEDTTYLDKTAASARKQLSGAIRFTGETDQVHLNTASTCRIDDPEWQRSIIVEKDGSNTTVVWNPWIEKNSRLADMAPDDWQSMLCVETANALENAVVLPPGGTHRMGATIRLGN